MGEAAQVQVVREAPGEAARRERWLAIERVRRDERGAGLCRRSHRLCDPAVHGDELTETDGHDVSCLRGVVVDVGQLEPGENRIPYVAQAREASRATSARCALQELPRRAS